MKFRVLDWHQLRRVGTRIPTLPTMPCCPWDSSLTVSRSKKRPEATLHFLTASKALNPQPHRSPTRPELNLISVLLSCIAFWDSESYENICPPLLRWISHSCEYKSCIMVNELKVRRSSCSFVLVFFPPESKSKS